MNERPHVELGVLPTNGTRPDDSTTDISTKESATKTESSPLPKIRVLPASVVQRIAAGEVVQRAASALKELIENSLDAGATQIQITVLAGTTAVKKHAALTAFTIADNGCGIGRDDLPLVCTRHATSKLQTAEDLNSMQTYGFRGEALCSLSHVARSVTVTSKPHNAPVGFQQSYANGHPLHANAKPVARTVGTTIAVTDLFATVPSRHHLRWATEYAAVVSVVQKYAIHCAIATCKGVAFSCTKVAAASKPSTDVQTAPFVAARRTRASTSTVDRSAQRHTTATQVVAHVYGADLIPHLVSLECRLDEALDSETKSDDTLVYRCRGYIAAATLNPSQGRATPPPHRARATTCIVFVNHRLVDPCPTLQRALYDVYHAHAASHGTTSNNVPPLWMYLSFLVPPHTVDVNVHPTKRHVTLLHLDRIVQDVSSHVRQRLATVGRSFASLTHAVPSSRVQHNDAPGESPPQQSSKVPSTKRKHSTLEDNDTYDESPIQQPKPQPTKPKSLVRTSRSSMPAGSLEPFLVRVTQKVSTQDDAETNHAFEPTNGTVARHQPNCPLHTKRHADSKEKDTGIDLSIPGAFAVAAARCECPVAYKTSMAPPVQRVSLSPPVNSRLRIHRVTPTPCRYTSIQELRNRVQRQRSEPWHEPLRQACFVGLVSHDRSLIQCHDQLVLLHHGALAPQLFYQLALDRFGGCGVATVGGNEHAAAPDPNVTNVVGIDIVTVIGQFVQMEEVLQSTNSVDIASPHVTVNETNQILAEQAADCLLQHSEMLLEYYSIRIEKNNDGHVVLTGLPVLLEGFEPSPHGLPLFLLRLATEVDWSREKACFDGVCRELGHFYGRLACSKDDDMDDVASKVRHTIFPALSALLVPSKHTQQDFVSLASLPQLYRVFERC